MGKTVTVCEAGPRDGLEMAALRSARVRVQGGTNGDRQPSAELRSCGLSGMPL